jgi:hypothetical protein
MRGWRLRWHQPEPGGGIETKEKADFLCSLMSSSSAYSWHCNMLLYKIIIKSSIVCY